MNRRRFLALSAAGGAAALAGLGGYATLVEPRAVRFTRHAVRPRTSPQQREVTFVQISDLHLQRVGRTHRRIAARVNALRPDFVLFTGDSVDRRDRLGELASLLARFDPRTPKYAIPGNWEHWAGVDLDELASLYRAASCRLLVNESAVHETGGRSILLTGVDDLVGGRPDLAAALAGTVAADAHLLLAHCPGHRDLLTRAPPPPKRVEMPSPPPATVQGATLMLSGHTHGGQVKLLGWAPMLPQGSGGYVSGWYRGGGVPLYVSCGIGTSVAPVRIGAPPEVAVFTMWV